MIRYYFPAWKPPSLYSYISGFDIENGVFLSDSSLILPLDNYLGVHYTPYKQVKIPQYLIQRMRAEYLVPDVVRTIGMALSSPFPNDDNLVAQMIAAGKLLYFAESVLPDYPSYLLAGFTKEEYAWCIDNEQEIWGFFLGQDLLFTKDKLTLGKFMNEGPGTQGFPEGSPGRIGHFIGWQIVRSYAARHPKTELKTMMENRELSRIFDESGYKPSKK